MKKIIAPSNTVIHDLRELQENSPNSYEALVAISKRADQITRSTKEELFQKLEAFSSHIDNLEEVFENSEQIEVSKHYEKQPKAVLVAFEEYMKGKLKIELPKEEEE